MKKMVNSGVFGVFIPQTEFDEGLFLDKETKVKLQEKILKNDALIQSLKADLDMLQNGGIPNEKE